jgi:hypothetical protein
MDRNRLILFAELWRALGTVLSVIMYLAILVSKSASCKVIDSPPLPSFLPNWERASIKMRSACGACLNGKRTNTFLGFWTCFGLLVFS